MNDRSLLLLGILMTQSQHGYLINEFIEKNLNRIAEMKKPTAYATLDRLSDKGYVQISMDQEGNRPMRKVYAITPSGVEHFFDLLRNNLSQADKMNFTSDIGMMFVDHLPLEESVSLLEGRLHQLAEEIEQHESAPKHGFGLGVDLAMEHHIVHLKADYEWLLSVIERLKVNTKNSPTDF